MKRRSFLSRATLLGLPFAGAAGSAVAATTGAKDAASDVRSFGALGDGTTDDSAAIQAAVNASHAVYFPAGNYLVRKKVDLRSGSNLIGDGSATLRTDGTSYILSAVGRIGGRRAPRKNIRRGDSSIQAATSTGANYRDAGGFFLQSDKVPLGHATHRSGELGIITTVNRDQVIVAGAVLDDYALNDKALMAPVTFVENISISGLRLHNDNYSGDPSRVTSALIYLEFVREFRVQECTLTRNNSAGISTFNCLNGVISNNTIGQLRDGGKGILGYGVQIGYSSQNIVISGNAMSECRHAVTTGTGTRSGRTPNYGVSRGLAIVGNAVSNCTNTGLDTHADSDGVTISGNSVVACQPVGIHVRSYRSSICGNTITACTGKGIRISKTARDSVASANIIAEIRRRSSDGDGIVVDSPSVTVSGNHIANCDRHGVSVENNASSDISISGNSCRNNGQAVSGDGINISRRGALSRLTVVGNTCTDDQATRTQRHGFSIEAGTRVSASDCLVASNNFSSAAEKSVAHKGSGTLAGNSNLGQEGVGVFPAGSTAPSVAGGTLFRCSGSSRINDFAAGVVGQTIQIVASATTTIVNSPRLVLSKRRDYVMSNADTLTLTMFEDGIWSEVARAASKA